MIRDLDPFVLRGSTTAEEVAAAAEAYVPLANHRALLATLDLGLPGPDPDLDASAVPLDGATLAGVVAFLAALSALAPPIGLIYVWVSPAPADEGEEWADPRTRYVRGEWFPVARPHAAIAWALAYNAKHFNAYVAANPFARRTGLLDDVLHVGVLPLDFDTPEKAEHGAAQLHRAGLTPSISVASGRPGARHHYLLLDQAYDVWHARPIARRLKNWTGSDPTHNANRLMRLPGSVNHKPAAAGARASLLHLDPTHRSLAEVDAALDRAGAPPDVEPEADRARRRAAARRADPARPRDPASARLRRYGHVEPIDPADLDTPLIARLATLRASLSARLCRVLADARSGALPVGERSGPEMGIVRRLTQVGASDDDVLLLLNLERWPRLFELGEDALLRTLANVRDTEPPPLPPLPPDNRPRTPVRLESVRVAVAKRSRTSRLVVDLLDLSTSPPRPLTVGIGLDQPAVLAHARSAFQLGPDATAEPWIKAFGRTAQVVLTETPSGTNVDRWGPDDCAATATAAAAAALGDVGDDLLDDDLDDLGDDLLCDLREDVDEGDGPDLDPGDRPDV